MLFDLCLRTFCQQEKDRFTRGYRQEVAHLVPSVQMRLVLYSSFKSKPQ